MSTSSPIAPQSLVAPHIRGLIFDLDGTVADTMPVHFDAWCDVARRFNFAYSKEVFLELAGMPTFRIVRIINERNGGSIDPDLVEQEKEKYLFSHFDRITLIEPVMAVVRAFHGKLPMAIGTGGKRDIALKTLDHLHIGHFFSCVVAAEDVSHHKPHPETFLRCAELIGIPPRDCQVFEDGDKGIEAAVAAGMTVTDIRPLAPATY